MPRSAISRRTSLAKSAIRVCQSCRGADLWTTVDLRTVAKDATVHYSHITPGARLTAGICVGTRDWEARHMGRAAASRGEIRAALDELEFHWGSAYHIAVADGVYTARRLDGKGAPLTDPLPAGLRLRIQADYTALPVPRDLP